MLATVRCFDCEQSLLADAFYASTLRGTGGKRCRACMRAADERLRRSRGVAPRRLLTRDDGLRVCTRCEIAQPLENFYVSKGRVAPDCKPCRAVWQREYAERRPGLHTQRVAKVRAKKRAWFEALKRTCACTECGESHPAVLDWHHKDPTTKLFSIAWGVANCRSLAKLQAEVEKCVVLCANCHRKLHYTERERRRAVRTLLQEIG